MLALSRPLGVAVRKHVSAVVFVNHASAATDVTGLAGMAQWMSVDGADHITRLETGCGIDLHCYGGTLGQHRRNMFGIKDALRGRVVCWTRGLSGCQFLCGQEARFDHRFFRLAEPVFLMG